MSANVGRPQAVTKRALLRQQHVTPKIMYVFAEQLEQTLVHALFLEKHVKAMFVSVVLLILALEAQQLQHVTALLICVCAAVMPLAPILVKHLNAM